MLRKKENFIFTISSSYQLIETSSIILDHRLYNCSRIKPPEHLDSRTENKRIFNLHEELVHIPSSQLRSINLAQPSHFRDSMAEKKLINFIKTSQQLVANRQLLNQTKGSLTLRNNLTTLSSFNELELPTIYIFCLKAKLYEIEMSI